MPLPSPFEHAAGRRSEAESLVVLVETDDGVVGIGEGAPRVHVTGESLDDALEAVTRLDVRRLEPVFAAPTFGDGVRRVEALDLAASLAGGTAVRWQGAAACAVELAVLDALGTVGARRWQRSRRRSTCRSRCGAAAGASTGSA